MQRVRLANLKLGDPDDVEIYASAAIWDWMQKPEFERLKEFNITTDQMTLTRGVMLPHSITVDVWTKVDDEVAVLLRLSGLSY